MLNWNLNKSRWLLSVCLMTGAFLIFNSLLLRRLAVGIWDANDFYHQYQILAADYARAGRFLHWDPWTNAGTSAAADPQTGAFSPVTFLVGLMTARTTYGFTVYWLLMWWLGGFGMLMLARHLKAPPWGACAVALGFLYSGFYTGHAQHTSAIAAFSFLPLLIWRLDVALLTRKRLPAVEAGALLGLSALAGYPALIILNGCFCALWAAGRWLCAESSSDEPSSMEFQPDAPDTAKPVDQLVSLRTVFSSLTLMLLVGIVILSPAYFAFLYEAVGIQQRAGGVSLQAALVNSLHPGALATFASPYMVLLKSYNHGQLWPYTDIAMCSIYAGALTLTLAVLALIRHPRNRWRWWLVALGVLSLSCALGQVLPLRAWLYDWFYPMRFFRHPALFRGYYLFAASVLALIATRDLASALRNSPDRIWKDFCTVSCWISLVAVMVFITLINSGLNAGHESVEFLNTGLNAGSVSLLLGKLHLLVWIMVSIAATFLWLGAVRWRRWSVPLLILILAVSDAFLTNAVSQPTMIVTLPEYVSRWRDLNLRHSTSLDLTGNGLRRDESSCYPDPPCNNFTNDQLVTKVPVLRSYYYTAEGMDFFRETVERPVLKQLAIGANRIWFSPRAEQISRTVNSFAEYLRRAERLGVPPLVIHTPQEMRQQKQLVESDEIAIQQSRQIESLPAVENINIELIRYLPDELSFNVQGPTDGWLLVTDRWARSWRAEVNDKRVSVYGGNFIFRAIPIQAGHNKIKFTYAPRGFPWLIIMSWGTLAIVLMISIYSHTGGTRTLLSRFWRGWLRQSSSRQHKPRTSLHSGSLPDSTDITYPDDVESKKANAQSLTTDR